MALLLHICCANPQTLTHEHILLCSNQKCMGASAMLLSSPARSRWLHACAGPALMEDGQTFEKMQLVSSGTAASG